MSLTRPTVSATERINALRTLTRPTVSATVARDAPQPTNALDNIDDHAPAEAEVSDSPALPLINKGASLPTPATSAPLPAFTKAVAFTAAAASLAAANISENIILVGGNGNRNRRRRPLTRTQRIIVIVVTIVVGLGLLLLLTILCLLRKRQQKKRHAAIQQHQSLNASQQQQYSSPYAVGNMTEQGQAPQTYAAPPGAPPQGQGYGYPQNNQTGYPEANGATAQPGQGYPKPGY
ncbi:hypothetical protein CF327_g6154 [Tilletia walkeri]|uniref:Uncharacterized protein n=1 Tax=Tilletia walkeri TaxID=117179 RepID=A0A8X7N614_9BASI|nr:hypothetical protein CF327_g6154 [Tilletia walkeri]KAE8267023.1 hypothetical protein A4X09_0g5329 [Tilletia walkeri]